MEAVRTILEGQNPEEGQTPHVHLFRAKNCAEGLTSKTLDRDPACVIPDKKRDL